jgi:hypothetical protein
MLVEIILKILHLLANTSLKLSLGQFYLSFPQIAFHPFQPPVRAAHFVQVLAQYQSRISLLLAKAGCSRSIQPLACSNEPMKIEDFGNVQLS